MGPAPVGGREFDRLRLRDRGGFDRDLERARDLLDGPARHVEVADRRRAVRRRADESDAPVREIHAVDLEVVEAEGLETTPEAHTAEIRDAVLDRDRHDLVVGDERPLAHAEHPVGQGELGLPWAQCARARVRLEVEVPIAAAVRHPGEPSARRERGLHDGLPGTAGDHPRGGTRTLGAEVNG